MGKTLQESCPLKQRESIETKGNQQKPIGAVERCHKYEKQLKQHFKGKNIARKVVKCSPLKQRESIETKGNQQKPIGLVERMGEDILAACFYSRRIHHTNWCCRTAKTASSSLSSQSSSSSFSLPSSLKAALFHQHLF